MIVIVVLQRDQKVMFKYKESYLEDAMRFVSECIETGEPGTQVVITMPREKEVK